ncbi:MAG: tRNA (cytidine(34)-2'-O)-methyltransferase [Hyphomicrobiaceae bacterium]
MRLALYQPDIPQNTGTILRLAACLGVPVDIIGPAGFDMRDSALRRAGLDYLDHVSLQRHVSFTAYLDARPAGRLVLLTTRGDIRHTDYRFQTGDTLLLGRESAGVPENVHERADARLAIPIQPGLRSLNVAVAGAIALGEALRQTGGFPAIDPASAVGRPPNRI